MIRTPTRNNSGTSDTGFPTQKTDNNSLVSLLNTGGMAADGHKQGLSQVAMEVETSQQITANNKTPGDKVEGRKMLDTWNRIQEIESTEQGLRDKIGENLEKMTAVVDPPKTYTRPSRTT
ncbi:hypothetical protein TSAR_003406 [Trichomalopsis sarcophagae]|uniref:Uncharacterized protein n=1 Tax=Trichomalopsis sarcophagae TaxID=543379 RepID=A0A232FHP5_9HYME|nr:hypothetical protein TSAR_003406 [Trichomalopsis sarcophagae]